MYGKYTALVTQCYEKLSEKNREIIDNYYQRNGASAHSYADIASLYGDTRQNIESIIKRFRNHITNILSGGIYKQITASEDLILWYSDKVERLTPIKYLSLEQFSKIINMDIPDTFYLNLTFDIYGVHKTEIEEYSIILHKKSIQVQTVTTIIKTLTNVLNDEIFWINSFDLIIQTNKTIYCKITKSEFEIISKTMTNLEFDNESNVRLKYEYLSSMEKKALRILDEKSEPAHKLEIFQELTTRENANKNLVQIDSLVNVLSANPYVKSIGKTGKWILSKYYFDTRHQADIIQWAFHENNPKCKPLTANEIYSKVCTSRSDLKIGIIYSYLNTLKDRFVPIGNGNYILTSWKRRYQKEIKSYEKNKIDRSRLELVLRSTLADGIAMTQKQIEEVLKAENINLSGGRVFSLLQNNYMESFKVKNRNFYRLKVSSDENRLEFLKAIKSIMLEIKNGVENRKTYGAFYNHDEPKSEPHIQSEIYERMRGYLKAEGIDISREAFTGLGPVDFKFSKGYRLRVFMELKLASNPNVLEGLTAQLPQYMGSEAVKLGIFTVIILSDSNFNQTEIIRDSIKELETKYSMHIEFVIIDGRKDLHTKYPSQLKSGEERVAMELLS